MTVLEKAIAKANKQVNQLAKLQSQLLGDYLSPAKNDYSTGKTCDDIERENREFHNRNTK